MKQREGARPKASSTQERLIERETFQYVTTNPRKYGVASTRNERQLAKAMDSLHMQQNKRLAELSSQIYEVKVHQWKLKEVDETSWDTDEKLLGSTDEDANDEAEPKAAPVTRGRIGKQSTTQNTRNEDVLQRVGLRQNRPMTSGDTTENRKAPRLKTMGKIVKYDKVNGHDSKLTKDSLRTTNGSNRQSSNHGLAVDYTLKDVPVRRDPLTFKHHQYKSYNLMNSQKSTGKRGSSPRDGAKHSKEAKNGFHGVNDIREKIAGNKNHNGKINMKPDTQTHSGHVAKVSETDPMIHGHRAMTIPHFLTNPHYHEASSVHHEGEAAVSDQETEGYEQQHGPMEENWAETLKSCRYLRKPRGYETPDITIESIFQND